MASRRRLCCCAQWRAEQGPRPPRAASPIPIRQGSLLPPTNINITSISEFRPPQATVLPHLPDPCSLPTERPPPRPISLSPPTLCSFVLDHHPAPPFSAPCSTTTTPPDTRARHSPVIPAHAVSHPPRPPSLPTCCPRQRRWRLSLALYSANRRTQTRYIATMQTSSCTRPSPSRARASSSYVPCPPSSSTAHLHVIPRFHSPSLRVPHVARTSAAPAWLVS